MSSRPEGMVELTDELDPLPEGTDDELFPDEELVELVMFKVTKPLGPKKETNQL